jgi:hypothetical protein
MKLQLAAGLLASVLAVSAAHAAPTPDETPGKAIDRAAALTAPVEDLARDALFNAAPRFVEVERPNFTGMMGPDAPLHALHFATAARSAGYPGLCKATTAWIDLRDGDPPMETETVYKVVGDLKPLPDMWNDAYGAELERKCAGAGRVLPTASADFGQARFFTIDPGARDDVWLAVLTLQMAIADAKGGAPVTCATPEDMTMDAATLNELAADDPDAVEQRENQRGCAEPGLVAGALKLDRLLSLDVAVCPGETRVYCVGGNFLRWASNNHQAIWRLEAKAERRPGDTGDPTGASAMALVPTYAVYD